MIMTSFLLHHLQHNSLTNMSLSTYLYTDDLQCFKLPLW